jgi:predicted permease
MMESVLLSLLGGGLGFALAKGALQGIRVLGSANVPFIREATVDAAVVVFTAGLSLTTALIFGLLPALRQSQVEAADSLRTGTRTTAGPQIRAWQRGLLVGQIAIVFVLLASAGLLLESFRRLMAQDLGYKPQSVIALDLSRPGFPTNEETCRMYRALHARLAAMPDVEAVGTISSTPLTGKWTFNEKAQVVGQPVPEAERPSLAATFVAFDYFQAMGIPLVDGRFFRDAELKDNGYGQIVILNQAAATLLFPRERPGKRISFNNRPDRWSRSDGVVKDTRRGLEQKAEPRFYQSFAFGGAQFVVRSSAPTSVTIRLLRDRLNQFGNRIIIHEIRPLKEIISGTVAERRFLMTMLATYAVVALGIAAVGIFGVVAGQVVQRTDDRRRLALGASPRAYPSGSMQASRLVLVGLAIGLLVARDQPTARQPALRPVLAIPSCC